MVTAPPRRPNSSPQEDTTGATAAAAPDSATALVTAPSPRQSRPAGISFDRFILGQVPLFLAVAIIFSLIAAVTMNNLPVGGTASAPIAATSGGGDAAYTTSTTFTSDVVAQVVNVAADPAGALKWDKATYEATAGDITFQVANKSVVPHNFAIEGNGIKAQSKDFGPNTANTYTIKGLKAGEYLIVCNYPGHRDAGMIAKLIVR